MSGVSTSPTSSYRYSINREVVTPSTSTASVSTRAVSPFYGPSTSSRNLPSSRTSYPMLPRKPSGPLDELFLQLPSEAQQVILHCIVDLISTAEEHQFRSVEELYHDLKILQIFLSRYPRDPVLRQTQDALSGGLQGKILACLKENLIFRYAQSNQPTQEVQNIFSFFSRMLGDTESVPLEDRLTVLAKRGVKIEGRDCCFLPFFPPDIAKLFIHFQRDPKVLKQAFFIWLEILSLLTESSKPDRRRIESRALQVLGFEDGRMALSSTRMPKTPIGTPIVRWKKSDALELLEAVLATSVVNPNEPNRKGIPALHLCGDPEAVALLIHYRACVDISKPYHSDSPSLTGNYPLHTAITSGWPSAKTLLGAKADPNSTDALDQTPLHRCVDPEQVSLLISHRAHVDALDINRVPPIHVAFQQAQECDLSIPEKEKRWKVIDSLIAAKANVGLQNIAGASFSTLVRQALIAAQKGPDLLSIYTHQKLGELDQHMSASFSSSNSLCVIA